MNRILRLALLVVLTVLVQVAVMPHLAVAGVVPDLGLVLAVAVAYRLDPVTAACVGFATGLGVDLFLETPLGLSALTYSLTGYVAGVLLAGMLRPPRGVSVLLGFLAGIGGGLAFLAIGVVAGADVLLDVRSLVTVVEAALYDAAVAPLVFFVVGRIAPREPVEAVWPL